MTHDDARTLVLAHLREHKRAHNDELIALLGGDDELFRRVRDDLIFEDLAADKNGVGLIYTGPVEDAPLASVEAVPSNDGRFDFFVSYAHADDAEGMVTALVAEIQRIQQQFERGRLRVFFDREGIRLMQDWELRIKGAVRSSKAMLAVLSPAYFASDYCRKEWEWFVDREVEISLPIQAIAPLYTVTVPGFEEDVEQLRDEWLRDLKRRQYVDVSDFWTEGLPALQREAVRARMAKLEQACYDKILRAERALGSKSTIPPHNRYFVGRHEELRRLRERLVEGSVGTLVAAQGLGGMGKSALAFEYAHAFADQYPGGRFLIEAEGRSDLQAAIIGLAEPKGVALSDEERRDPEAAYRKVRAAFEQGEPSLLLFDNVSEPELLAPAQVAAHLPSGPNVHVLATTRLAPERLDAQQVAVVEVGPLPEADALRLLNTYRPFHDEPNPDAARLAAEQIVRRLDGYTLALEVVAVFLWKTPEVSYPGFLGRLEQEDLAALEGVGADDRVALSRHRETVVSRLLAPTLDKLSEAERLTLDYAAAMPPDAVVWPWLRTLVEQEKPGLVPEAKIGYPDPWLAVQRRLHGLRLLTPGDDVRVSRMHRVVRAVVRQRMEAEAVKQRERAIYDLVLARAEARRSRPATPARILLANDELEAGGLPPIPEDYQELLSVANGIQSRAFILLGTEPMPMAGDHWANAIYDETEESWHLVGEGELVLGRLVGGMSLVYAARERKYHMVDASKSRRSGCL